MISALPWVRDELARRIALAREPRPKGVRRPSALLFLAEIPGVANRLAGPAKVTPANRPRPVMLLPGFGADPRRMQPLGATLEAAGHRVHDWGLGFNFGPTPQNFGYLLRRVRVLSQLENAPVSLVGWSLGGLFAREIARRVPEYVDSVITLGSPFSGDPHANNAWRAYQFVAGHSVSSPPIDGCDFGEKPPVPTIALWSPRDGVIHPRAASGWRHERDRAVAMRCTHMGFTTDPTTLREVARQLDETDLLSRPEN